MESRSEWREVFTVCFLGSVKLDITTSWFIKPHRWWLSYLGDQHFCLARPIMDRVIPSDSYYLHFNHTPIYIYLRYSTIVTSCSWMWFYPNKTAVGIQSFTQSLKTTLVGSSGTCFGKLWWKRPKSYGAPMGLWELRWFQNWKWPSDFAHFDAELMIFIWFYHVLPYFC